jgi:uncharacterized protein YecE (DUF72 family)
MAIRVGCGSWSDKEYAPLLDPEGKDRKRPLAAYARWFDCAEVNSSYYAIPKPAAVEQWVEQTPPGFLFDFKLHRVLSMAPARAGEPGDGKRDLVAATLEAVAPLIEAKKFGVFFLLLSPFFKPDKHELTELDALVARLRPHRLAVEMRHRGWIEGKQREKTLAYFRGQGLTWITVDMPPLEDDSLLPFLEDVTDPALAYVRLHGRNPLYLEAKSAAERHTYLYPPKEIAALVKKIGKLAERAAEVRVVANNHAQDFAPRTALELKRVFAKS